MKVDLPEPDGPIMTTLSSSFTVRLMPASASKLSNYLCTSRHMMILIAFRLSALCSSCAQGLDAHSHLLLIEAHKCAVIDPGALRIPNTDPPAAVFQATGLRRPY